MYGCGYIDLEEAYLSSFSQFFCPDKQDFRDKLLYEIHGLHVYVITQPITCKIFLVLAPVVQRVDNFIHWISQYPAEQMYSNQRFWQVFRTIPYLNLTYASPPSTNYRAIEKILHTFHLLDSDLSSG